MSKAYLRVLLACCLASLAFTTAPTPARAATITVNSTADVVANDGQCTLREAITAANTDSASGAMAGECPAGSGADVIELAAETYTLVIAGANEDNNTAGDLDIRANLTINGQGAGSTIVQAGTNAENGIDRVFDIRGVGITVNINDLTIRHGNLSGSGGGVHVFFAINPTLNINDSAITANQASANGGGLAAFSGTTNVNNSTISDNVAFFGGGLSNGRIDVSSTGTFNVANSSITGNQAVSILMGFGGGVLNNGTMNIANSTISGNSVYVAGGGLYNRGGEANVTNVTIIDNSADVDIEELDDEPGDGGGIANEAGSTLNLKSSLVAENIDLGGENPDIAGALDSDGYNLIGDVGQTNFASNTTGDQYGDPNGTTTPNTGAIETGSAVDPLVGALTGNPAYHPLLEGSPAIDQIPPANCTYLSSGTNPLFSDGSAVQRDQVNTPRPADGMCEVGAIEIPGEVPASGEIFLPILFRQS